MSRTKHVIHGTRPPTNELLCQNCDCVLEPMFDIDYREMKFNDGSGFTTEPFYTGEVLGYGYRGDGQFCTMTCGYRFGLRCVEAGVKLKRLDPERAGRKRKKAKPVSDPDAVSIKVED